MALQAPIGAALRQARILAGFGRHGGVAEAAAEIGIGAQTLSAYESGARQPQPVRLRRILDAYGCELVALPKPAADAIRAWQRAAATLDVAAWWERREEPRPAFCGRPKQRGDVDYLRELAGRLLAAVVGS